MVDKAPAGSRYLKKLLLHSCIIAPTNPQHIQQFEAEFGVRVLQQKLGVNELAGITDACGNLSPGLQRGSAASSHHDAVRKETKLELSCQHCSCFSAVLLIHPCGSGLRASFSGVCVFAQALSLLFHNSLPSETKQKNRGVLGKRSMHSALSAFGSYLKGLNVNRLLLAIVLASAPPVIIFQKERPLTSLLTSHHGTSGGQTFSPRPIHQRYTAAFTRVISHGHVSRRKNETDFYSGCPV